MDEASTTTPLCLRTIPAELACKERTPGAARLRWCGGRQAARASERSRPRLGASLPRRCISGSGIVRLSVTPLGDAARCVGAVRWGCRTGSCRLSGGGAIEARCSTHRWSGWRWFVLRRFDRGSGSVAWRWSRVSISQWHCRPGCFSAGVGGSAPGDGGAVGHGARLFAAVAPCRGNFSSGR